MFSSVARVAKQARQFSSTAAAQEVQKVGVIGMGLMGHGIAQTAAAAGYEVVGLETQQVRAEMAVMLSLLALTATHSA